MLCTSISKPFPIYDVIIVGGGPAGSSAAISLASAGVRVLVLEEKRAPRNKVCGEFLTPESFPSLQRLGVAERLTLAGAAKIRSLALSAPGRAPIQFPIAEISSGEAALSISRLRMDQILLERAQECGAECLTGMAVKRCLYENGRPVGVECTTVPEGKTVSFKGALVLDASGRGSRLMRDSSDRRRGIRETRLFAMKAHFSGVDLPADQVHLFFFPGGYGGLSMIEAGLANLCFITSRSTLRETGADPGKVLKRSVFLNWFAGSSLNEARIEGRWLSVGPLVFGRRRLFRNGLIAVGDSGGMIDPFTGTGMQIALRSGELVSQAFFDRFDETSARIGTTSSFPDEVSERYARLYGAEFTTRMSVAGMLRKIAFSDVGRAAAGRFFSAAPTITRRILRSTRAS